MADNGFGSGSSREDAVRALLGAGVEAVIAQGFAFICKFDIFISLISILLYQCNSCRLTGLLDERNQLNMGLFNIKLQDPDFYRNIHEGSIVKINKDEKTITIEGLRKAFHYHHTTIEETLLNAGGVLPLYGQFGVNLFRRITTPSSRNGKRRRVGSNGQRQESGGLQW